MVRMIITPAVFKNERTRVYAVKFVYENDPVCLQKSCIVFAESKEQAMDVFNRRMPLIFYQYGDQCVVVDILEINQDVDLIYEQGGTVWSTHSDRKLIW